MHSRPERVLASPTATVPLERNFQPFAQLPEQQQTALSRVLQAVLFDEELLLVLEQVVRPATSRGAGSPLGVPEMWAGWTAWERLWPELETNTAFTISPPLLNTKAFCFLSQVLSVLTAEGI